MQPGITDYLRPLFAVDSPYVQDVLAILRLALAPCIVAREGDYPSERQLQEEISHVVDCFAKRRGDFRLSLQGRLTSDDITVSGAFKSGTLSFLSIDYVQKRIERHSTWPRTIDTCADVLRGDRRDEERSEIQELLHQLERTAPAMLQVPPPRAKEI